MRQLQVKNADVVSINDALRQIYETFLEAMPAAAVILWPTGKPLPLGWAIADGTKDRPDLRGHGIGSHQYIVRLI